jgi:MFS family permease
VWLLAFVALVNRTGTMVLPFITLYLTLERGFSVKEAGQIVGLYGLGSVGGSYLGGWLSDRIGAVRTLQASLVLGGIGLLVLGSARERITIAATVLVVSLVVEAFRPAVMSSFAERSPEPVQAKSFALLRLAANFGISIGPALGGLLALYSYWWLFVADAVTCWLAAALLIRLPETRETEEVHEPTTQTPQRSPWRDGPFLALLVLVIALASVFFQFFSTLPLYFHEVVGLQENAIGLLLFLNGFLIAVFEMVLIHTVQRFNRISLAGLGALVLCLGFALIPYGKTPWYMALTVAVWTFGEMLALPILNAIVGQRAGKGYRGQYMGMYTMAYSFAFVIAPIMGTFIYERFGPASLWHSFGFLGILLWLAFTALKKPLGGTDPSR